MKYFALLLSVFLFCSGSSGDHGKLKYFKADPDQGFAFPFYLFIPEDIPRGDSTWLILEPNNTGIYKEQEVDAVTRTIPGLGHAHPDSVKNDIVQFFREKIQ